MPKSSVACMCPRDVYLNIPVCVPNKPVTRGRLISRFSSGCRNLRVDTGGWADSVHLDRTDRSCLVCKSLNCVEDKQHFDCPVYSHMHSLQAFGPLAAMLYYCRRHDCVRTNTFGGFLRECFACRKQVWSV